MASTALWYKYADEVIGIDTFGASAPAETVIREYGFTVERYSFDIRYIHESGYI